VTQIPVDGLERPSAVSAIAAFLQLISFPNVPEQFVQRTEENYDQEEEQKDHSTNYTSNDVQISLEVILVVLQLNKLQANASEGVVDWKELTVGIGDFSVDQ
jgi:hypothetical protein